MDLGKVLRQVQPEYEGRIVFVTVDVYDAGEQALIESVGVPRIPYSVLLDAGGNRVDAFTGTLSASALRARLDQLLRSAGG